jgi:hypothetical protein
LDRANEGRAHATSAGHARRPSFRQELASNRKNVPAPSFGVESSHTYGGDRI